MGVDISNDLDVLFGDSELPGDPTGGLASLAGMLERVRPRLLVLLGGDGALLGTWQGDAGITAERAHRLAHRHLRSRGPAKETDDAPWSAVREPDDGECAFVVRGARSEEPSGPSAGTLIGLAPEGTEPVDLTPPTDLVALRIAIDLAVQLARADADRRGSEIRNRHLQAEQDTLKRSYAQIMSNALEEREQRLREQREYMVHLEKEVSRRSSDLRDALERANSANHTKSEFLANMSHEIRTPMTAILGYTDLLIEESWGRPKSLEWLYIVRRNGQHLLEIINDILDISKIEAGKLQVETVRFSPAQLLGEVVDLIRSRAIEKGLELTAECDGPVPETIESDPTRLKQILVNLVGNAVKFTQQGCIRVVLRLLPGGPATQGARTTPQLAFEVVDSGIGMTHEQTSRLFKPFSQADSSTTRKFGGTGLGLAISKRLSQMLGGDILVRSTPDVGSTFTLTIDPGKLEGVGMVEAPPAADPLPPRPTPLIGGAKLDGKRVLLAEDGLDNQRLITMILERAGASVVIAENGRIACERIEQAAAKNEPFDLVLMDMQMPEMDGYTATSRLRHMGYNLPIVALTAHAMSGDREKCLDAGCTDYATKPIDVRKLLNLLVTHAVPGQAAGADEERVANDDAVVQPGAAEMPPLDRRSHPATAARVAGGRHTTPPPLSPDGPLFSTMASDPDMAELIDLFISDLPQRIGLLQEALTAGDLQTLAKLTHQLKGSAGGFGFDTITESAGRVERMIRADGDVAKVESRVNDLVALCRRAMRLKPNNPDG